MPQASSTPGPAGATPKSKNLGTTWTSTSSLASRRSRSTSSDSRRSPKATITRVTWWCTRIDSMVVDVAEHRGAAHERLVDETDEVDPQLTML